MGQEFWAYVQLGFHHIADPKACDHLLFILTLCAAYALRAWRQILLLVTAFTLGHSLTLALAALGWVQVRSEWVEMLIPITILLTGLYNVLTRPRNEARAFGRPALVRYGLALFFGLIHGLGFSNFFRTLMGETGSIVWPLFSFNVGIELGQLLIVAAFFTLQWAIERFHALALREWNLFISGMGVGGALLLILGQL